MKPKLTTPLLAAIGAMVMVSTLFLSFYLSTQAYRAEDSSIILPSDVDNLAVTDMTQKEDTETKISEVELTTQNVQRVISSLHRTEAYRCTIQNTIYYNGESSTVTRYQSVRDGVCRTDEANASGSIIRSTIQNAERYYVWDTGRSDFYQGEVGLFSGDVTGMLPTYETVLNLPAEALREVNVVNLDYEPCIVVGSVEGNFHSVYYISTVTGLLKRADMFDEGTLIRSCVVKLTANQEPDRSVYTLPNGTVVEGIQK